MKALVLAGWKRACTVSAVVRLADYFGYDEVVLYDKDKSYVPDPYLKNCLAAYPGELPPIKQFHEVEPFIQYVDEKVDGVLVLDTTPISNPYTADVFRLPHMKNHAIVVGHEDRGVPDEIIERYGAYQIKKRGVMECLCSVSALTIAAWDEHNTGGEK